MFGMLFWIYGMENRREVRVILERLIGDFILRVIGSYGEMLRRRWEW